MERINEMEGKSYKTIGLKRISENMDQTKLSSFVIKDLKTVKDSINAIKTMEVRGAPLIGATAAYGLVLSQWRIMTTLKNQVRILLHQDPLQ